ncbi:MAG: MarP family serine protease [Janibacter sp.]|nr:MarP family serine protease [Janibacter sp.]
MTDSTILDLVLLLMLAGYVIGMYRSGLVAGLLSIVGMVTGGLLALWLLPGVFAQWSPTAADPLARAVLLVVGTIFAAGIGQSVGALIGVRWRTRVTHRPTRLVDSLLGGATALVVGSAVLWLMAGAVVAAHPSPAPTWLTGSRVLQQIDRAMPHGADRALSSAYQRLASDGLPRVFSGIGREPIRAVEPPEPGVVEGRGVAAAAASVVDVTALAPACGRGSSGSGWVVAPQRVVTNAHVVAGTSSPTVRVGGTGQALAATVVAFDPDRDVAVLAVPQLQAAPLPSGPDLTSGDSVAVAGFPLGGPYDVEAGRVRERLAARGTAIDGSPGVTRDIYAVSAEVEHGNSGGPLLSSTGQVVGTVFAKSLSHEGTGYVLTLDETRPVVEEGVRATSAVDTGDCAA